MSYSGIYHSPWHNPGLLLLGNGIFLIYMLVRKGGDAFLRKLLLSYAFLAIADILITGGLSPVPAYAQPYVPFPFIILGDTRFFFVVERYARPEARNSPVGRVFLKSFLISLIVPATAYFAQQGFFPKADARWMFLFYELFFLVVASCFIRIVFPAQSASADISPDQRRWLHGIILFELVFYALWATADVVILSGREWGYLLRIVPNVLYYVGFVWFVALTAPASIWGFGSPSAPYAPNPRDMRP